jgi:flagellar hook protein FlgE
MRATPRRTRLTASDKPAILKSFQTSRFGFVMSTTFGLFNSSIMGMSAQGDALANISENITNSNTTGYKRATTHFLTVLAGYQGPEQAGGGVATRSRHAVATQGALMQTDSTTDLAIRGKGFFVVTDSSGGIYLTRAGSFVPDSQGRLVNSAGYFLMGFPTGTTPDSMNNLQLMQVQKDRLYSNPSTSGVFSANLPSTAQVVAPATLPSTNAAGATFSAKSSLTVYDNLGTPVILDMYFSKTATNTWEASIYDAAGATNGGFPYAAPALATQTLTFSPANGDILTGSTISLTPPGGSTMSLDLGRVTQLGAPFGVNLASVNGNAAGAVKDLQITSDGTFSYHLDNGQFIPAYSIGIADVPAPTGLTSFTGGVYLATSDSGLITIGAPGSAGRGSIISSTLEGSTVDLSNELASMIIAQRAYTANTQAFQVASEILQLLSNIK